MSKQKMMRWKVDSDEDMKRFVKSDKDNDTPEEVQMWREIRKTVQKFSTTVQSTANLSVFQ